MLFSTIASEAFYIIFTNLAYWIFAVQYYQLKCKISGAPQPPQNLNKIMITINIVTPIGFCICLFTYNLENFTRSSWILVWTFAVLLATLQLITACVMIVALRGINQSLKDAVDRRNLNVKPVILLLVVYISYIVSSILNYFSWNNLGIPIAAFIGFNILYLIVYFFM